MIAVSRCSVELLETLSSCENKVHRRIFCEFKLFELSRNS